MDINLLVLDAGHSRLKVGVFEAGELTYTRRIGLDQTADWQGTVEEAWRRVADKGGAEVAGCASNPTIIAGVETAVRAATGQSVQWVGVGRDIAPPNKIATTHPEKTGIDRVLNVAAAHEQLGKACCVVDAGSAITVDFCDDDGTFLGGVIAPGAAAQFAALHRVAPHLPEPKLTYTTDAYGVDTESAVNAGVFHGLRGLVRATVEAFALSQSTWPETIATGGDAATLFGDDPAGGLIHAVSPDLLFYGIAHAFAEHGLRGTGGK